MNCSRCGIELPDKSNFCYNCGFPTKKSEEYETERGSGQSREYNARLIYQPDDHGTYIKIIASDLGMTDEELDRSSLADIAEAIGKKGSSVEQVRFDRGELILQIFSAWR